MLHITYARPQLPSHHLPLSEGLGEAEVAYLDMDWVSWTMDWGFY